MWRYATWGLLLLGLSTLMGCDLTDFEDPETTVVEAFVETNKMPPPVYVRNVQGLGETTPDGRSDAQIHMLLGDSVVAYASDADEAGRYVPESTGAPMSAHQPFEIEVQVDGKTARGASETPAAITLDSIAIRAPDEPIEAVRVDSLRRDSLDIPATTDFIYPIDVDVYWTAPTTDTGADTWVRTALRPADTPFTPRIVDFFIQPEAVFPESDAEASEAVRAWSGIYAIPVEEANETLPTHDLTVLVVRSGAAYAEYIAERDDPDRREPPSNVDGALGIVAGVAVDSIRVTVEQDTTTANMEDARYVYRAPRLDQW